MKGERGLYKGPCTGTMGDFFKNIKWSMMLPGIMTLVIGILIVMNPGGTVETIIKVVGWILIVAGAVSILGFALDKQKGIKSYGDIVVGVLVLAMGIILVITPKTFISFIGIIFGILLLVHGIYQIVTGFRNKGYQDSKWTHAMIFGLICIVLALIIIINPFASISSLMTLIGISLIVDGVSCIALAIRTGYIISRFKKSVAEAQEEKRRNEEMLNRMDVCENPDDTILNENTADNNSL
jgi:uncharacterized membrane protein HdeD (DUF308 family)